jgi:hypothetical protein
MGYLLKWFHIQEEMLILSEELPKIALKKRNYFDYLILM